MEKTQILQMSAVELGRAIREGRTTAVEATEAVLEQIEKTEEQYNCYITVAGERALEQAAQVQGKIESGELTGPLAGVPAAVKDNMCTEGIPTTCASRMLEGFVPGYTCEAVRRLEQAGVILIGKTNMDEFAMGSTTETSAFGVTRNPRNPRHVPGGSSGGSAAAVAAGPPPPLPAAAPPPAPVPAPLTTATTTIWRSASPTCSSPPSGTTRPVRSWLR